ncbi:response regulator transcription factor [Cohnella herbarum]|uniref:Response regulator n=1 Tax=Cohnella herbarum TaxID=2728023 RepID=A0A7Z2ZKB4_9BACL|nr:response regulator [Cohnella herbarum]QJD82793.1 response regulator [Cohnella herbarum]
MNRLLIVDDEPYTVDGLYEMLSNIEDLELDLYSDYSAEDAMHRLSRSKMDIVLSDIRMPGMDGLELQRWIRNRWPRCKIIFLTGIGDISYLQQAVRAGGIDYILKTEGDEAIVHAIRIAIAALEEEAKNDQFMLRAKEQVRQELLLLRREWFASLTDFACNPLVFTETRFRELELSVSPVDRVLLVLGRVDRWPENTTTSGKTLLIYAIQNIAEEYLGQTRFQSIVLNDSQFVWLIQPGDSEEGPGLARTWEETLTFAAGTLDSIQSTTKALLRLPLSLVTTGEPSGWEETHLTYNRVKKNLILGFGTGTEMLILRCDAGESPEYTHSLSIRKLAELETALETGRKDEFNEKLDVVFSMLPSAFGLYAQTYYSVASLLLGHLTKVSNGMTGNEAIMAKLMNLGHHVQKDSALQVLKDAAAGLFSGRMTTLDERTNRIVNKLNQHVREHLDGDLSLDRLSELVHLNSSYLSTMYKQYTGFNLSDYISALRVEKAKEMLEDSSWKIHEISVNVGFGTAGYFTRFFKKFTGLTPQEYRNGHAKWTGNEPANK